MFLSKSRYILLPMIAFIAGVTAFSCKKESALPPKAKNTFSSIENWPFGEDAFIHARNIVDFGPRPIESQPHQQTQAYITAELNKSGWAVSTQSFAAETPYGKRNFTNIIARYNVAEDGKATKTNSPQILLAAHYDSKLMDGFVGADDAATCVGGLLEIAKYLPKQPDSIAPLVELVFFDGEEALKKDLVQGVDGIYGSTYYSEFLKRDLASDKKMYQTRPKFGILLDMIGHKDLAIAIPADTPDILLESYRKIVVKHGLRKQFSVAGGRILDDHVPMNEIAMVPTIDLIGDFSRKTWWHTNDDNFSNVSKESLTISIQFALELLMDMHKKTIL